MTIQRMIELLEIESMCVDRNINKHCDRDCEHCDLAQNDKELQEMYSSVIELLDKAYVL